MMEQFRFFNRDISWLGFNSRVLEEAANGRLPVFERIKFLSIFSSNLDEFYRVRMPVIAALKKIGKKKNSELDAQEHSEIFDTVNATIAAQLNHFGEILKQQLLPALQSNDVHLLYHEPIPDELKPQFTLYFSTETMAFLHPITLKEGISFFPENNKLYFLIETVQADKSSLTVVNIPSDELQRFYSTTVNRQQYILFLDDIIRHNLDKLFGKVEIKSCYSFKVTRDAELDLKDDYSGDLSEEIEKQLNKRDLGLATRFLYDADMPQVLLEKIKDFFELKKATTVAGGCYHNLKDLISLPIEYKPLQNEVWPGIQPKWLSENTTIAESILQKDHIIHPPYNSYDAVLRFFNEAAVNPNVTEIYVTLYRVASHSLIVNALISAAKNGKKVEVVVELKARFDEANNLRWAKMMKAAGVNINYSVTALKVHAKIALVKEKQSDKTIYYGLMATGNLNETTARFYTDHILFTGNKAILREIELLFIILSKRQKPDKFKPDVNFEHLLVAQFNLKDRFMEMINREIENKKNGLESGIIIKLNNLEEETLISKLYEASQAGVNIQLIIRGVCCLIPGIQGMSENITIRRIVDRYLEHGRVFIFKNNGNDLVYMGSADWMNRNIYHRIEVCFPVYDTDIKQEMMLLIDIQLKDNTQAVMLNENLENIKIEASGREVESQKEIYELVKEANTK